jgi:hypothetical protein
MADGEIVLIKSARNGVEKLDFDRRGTSWRVVMIGSCARAGCRSKYIINQVQGTRHGARFREVRPGTA